MANTSKIELELRERIKELECLYNIGYEIEYNQDLATILLNSTEHLVKGFQFPEITIAFFVLDGKTYSKTEIPADMLNHVMCEDIIVNGTKRGSIEVAYTRKAEFLFEEAKLLKEVARMIAKSIEKIELQEKLKNYVDKLEEMVSSKTIEIEKAKKRFEHMFEYGPDAVAISRKSGEIIKANRAFYRMLQYPIDPAVNLNYLKDKLYENISILRPYILGQLEKHGFLEGFEMTLVDKYGNPCPVIGSFITIDVDGDQCIEAVFKDIKLRKQLEKRLIEQNENLEKIVRDRTKDLETKKSQLEKKHNDLLLATEKLKESKNRLQTLFNAITDTVVLMDKDFNIKMSNRDDIKNNADHFKKIFLADSESGESPIDNVFKNRNEVSREIKVGDDFFLVQAYPIFSSKNEVESVLGFAKLITKQKSIEMQLYQTDKLASIGLLVSGVAHEINNPNTFIRGNIAIVQEAMKDIIPLLDNVYESRKDLKIARLDYEIFKENILILIDDMANGANRIKTIVEDLRKFAKRDDGLKEDRIDINEVIESCIRLVHNQVKRNAEIITNLEDGTPVFIGSKQRIEQVIVNIILNASQAIKKQGQINITTLTDFRNEEIIVRIADNGIGMDENIMKNIFDPFFTTKKNSGGTGLGLSIAYGIVEDHGGKIDVESKVGTGTVFIIRFPFKSGDNK